MTASETHRHYPDDRHVMAADQPAPPGYYEVMETAVRELLRRRG